MRQEESGDLRFEIPNLKSEIILPWRFHLGVLAAWRLNLFR
jgi:hypothetical protein